MRKIPRECLSAEAARANSPRLNAATLIYHAAFAKLSSAPGLDDLWEEYQYDREASVSAEDAEGDRDANNSQSESAKRQRDEGGEVGDADGNEKDNDERPTKKPRSEQ